MEAIGEQRLFGGRQLRFRHRSDACACDMQFSVYLPPGEQPDGAPVVYWLSGLTCDDTNFPMKSGAQRYAAELGLALVIPDTSPRGEGVPDDPEGHWDFGLGAGFYVNATRAPWDANYRMYDYISRELPALVEDALSLDGTRRSICGHSMGGHGALVIGLRNPGRYRSISAFSPIVAPSGVPWGEKAFSHYLGDDRQAWYEYDACRLLESLDGTPPILIDQGESDEFLERELQPWRLDDFRQKHDICLRMQPGYDHSYYFIASFIGEHLRFHREHLGS